MKEKGNGNGASGVVLAAPGHFVFQFSDPVEGISPAEAEASARLAFEEESPFPPEAIAVGTAVGADGGVAVFGCETAALPEAGSGGFLLPAFLPFFGWEREAGAVELAETEEGVAVLFFDRGGRLPSDLVGFGKREEDGEPPWEEIEGTFAFLGRSWPGEDALPRLRLEAVAADSRGRFSAAVTDGDGRRHAWEAPADTLWKADLRPEDEIRRLRAERTAGERIWKAAGIAAGLLVFLVVAQAVLWGVGAWVDRLEEREAARAPRVSLVQERADLATRLADLGESRISVFQRLGELNLVRPNGIQFLTVEFAEPDLFEIEGRVNEVRVLNEYIEKLEADPRFLVSEAPRPRSRDGRIEFELGVRVPSTDSARPEPPLPPDGGGGAVSVGVQARSAPGSLGTPGRPAVRTAAEERS